MLVAHFSDIHVNGTRYREDLLRRTIDEINEAEPDLVVCAGDLTGDGYLDEFEAAREELRALACERIVVVPGNHDARNFGWVRYEETFGERHTRTRVEIDGMQVALVAVDTSKPDIDAGEIGRKRYGWIHEGFADEADVRLFVCHHHLLPVPGTGRARYQVHDAGEVLSLLRESQVELVLCGHKHVPYVWPIAGMLIVHSGTASTLKTRGFTDPAYNMVTIDEAEIAVELRVPGGERADLGRYPRRWPEALVARGRDPLSARGLYFGYREEPNAGLHAATVRERRQTRV